MHHNLSVLQCKKNSFFLNLNYFFFSIQQGTKKNTWEKWGDIGADCWFTEVSAPAAPCMLPYTAFPGFCETNLLCNKTDSKSEVSIWATPWKQTLLIYNAVFLVWEVELYWASWAHRKVRGPTPQLCQDNGTCGENGKLARSCVTMFPHQALVQGEILLVTKCPHSQGSGCWGPLRIGPR